MNWLTDLNSFLRSESVQEFWQVFHLALFWLSLLFTIGALWLLISTVRKYEKRKKQIQKELQAPGMEDVRHLFKPFLKEHGIKVDERSAERN